MPQTLPPPLFDPFAPGFTDNPYPQYAALRAAAPVYQDPLGFWLLTCYDHVSWLLRAGLSVEDRNVATSPLLERREQLYGEEAARPRVAMLYRDPPDHTRLRRLVSKAFTPGAVQALAPRITGLVDGLLDAAEQTGRVDLVDALAFPLPFAVIAEMLGTPPTDHERIRRLTGTVVRSLEPVVDPAVASAIAAAGSELRTIAADMLAWKRANPADDLLTALINAEDDGDVLDDEELVAQTLLLYIAGHETTVNLIAGGTLALLRHPAQLALLRDDPALITNAVEELLRYDSPVQASRRITLEPVSISGVTIPAGAFVMASLGSANRDEGYWGPDAAKLRLDRANARQHVSFGAGLHHCLGASLARLEASIALARLTTRFPGLALDGQVVWNGRINLRGPAHLPVSLGTSSGPLMGDLPSTLRPDSAGGARPVMMGGMGTPAAADDAPTGRGPALYLPAPTGPYPVGTTSLWLTDSSRPDPWAAEASARELMVSLWYPAVPTGGQRAQYMTPAESERQLTSRGIAGVPPDALSTVRTNAAVGAPPTGQQHSLPLVVLSPGFTNPRSTLTALAEDLASHGYVVAGIDHTYESFATAFPDGRVTTCLAREAPRRDRWEKIAAGRAADVSFVLGELTGAHPAWPGAGLIDPSAMAMAGHSIGGASAIAAMLADSRIRAGIDMDGATVAPIPKAGLSRPVLFLGKQANYTPGSGGAVTTWERDWTLLTGWKRWLVVAGAVHASFTDLALLADQLGIDIGAGLPGARALDITRSYVRACFDQHLRGSPQAPLDQPSPRYPEVTFCSPETETGT